ncbi:hypothetical protein [Pareuzebyella sediminis]|uniref:hypothetical protein n=1 Tax=Pareuzebyella sediminis TaxID=2607998 RepID=UPI0011EF2E73|nr:hypothetical protein [Pareuzebyella sediminis]
MTISKLKIPYRAKYLPYLVSLLLTLLILAIHMAPNMDSMLNENNTRISHVFLKSQIEYHKELPPFARRPLTSFLIDSTIELFGVRAGFAFIFVNFCFLFLSGLLLFKLALDLKATRRQALLNMIVYFLSFSILFAFFPPIFSYDEPLQYCFIFLAIISYFKDKWALFVLFFSLALIARETSILLLPAFFLFAVKGNIDKNISFNVSQKWGMLLAPVLIYGIYIGAFILTNEQLEETQLELGSRFSCFLENFESFKNTSESLLSIHFTLSFYLCLIFVPPKRSNTLSENMFVKAFLLTAFINTPIVLLTAFARESRLFTLPLLLIWPVFFQLFDKDLSYFFSRRFHKELFATASKSLGIIVFMAFNFIGCFILYKNLGLGKNTYFAEYLFLLNTFLFTYVWSKLRRG